MAGAQTAGHLVRAPPRHVHGDLTSLAPHETLPEILVVPREKTPTGAAARGRFNPWVGKSPWRREWQPFSLRPALSLGGQATAWECSPGRSLCLTKSSACGRLWQFAHPRPLSLLQRGLAPRSKGKARAELRPARREPMPKGRRPTGVTPRPRSGAAAESARLRQRRNGGEELPHVRGQGAQPTWVFFGRNDAKTETPVLWPPHVKS